VEQIFLQVGHIGAVDQCVDDEHRNAILHLLCRWLEAVEDHLVLVIDGLFRSDTGRNVAELHQVLQAVAELLAEVGERLECLIGAGLNGNHVHCSLSLLHGLAVGGLLRRALLWRSGFGWRRIFRRARVSGRFLLARGPRGSRRR